jgi:hypothetical protein
MGLPLREGYGARERAESGMRAHALKISDSATLADLLRDYAAFNHGAFFTHGRLDVDPVADFVTKHPDADVMAMPTTFDQPLFRGLAAPGRQPGPPLAWDRTLFFIERRFWDSLRAHLTTCGWIDRRRRTYGRAVRQVLPIIDFLALARAIVLPAPLPTVEIDVFGVDATNVHVQFVPQVILPGDVPALVHLPLVAETGTLGAALLSQDPRPFRFIETEDPLAGQQGIIPPAS